MTNSRTRFLVLFAATALGAACSVNVGPAPGSPDPVLAGSWVGDVSGVRVSVNLETLTGSRRKIGFMDTELAGTGIVMTLATGDSFAFTVTGFVLDERIGKVSFQLIAPGPSAPSPLYNYGTFTGQVSGVAGSSTLTGVVVGADWRRIGQFTGASIPDRPLTMMRP